MQMSCLIHHNVVICQHCGTCSSTVISEIILSEKMHIFYVAAGNEPRLLIVRSGFVHLANKLLLLHHHPPL